MKLRVTINHKPLQSSTDVTYVATAFVTVTKDKITEIKLVKKNPHVALLSQLLTKTVRTAVEEYLKDTKYNGFYDPETGLERIISVQ